MPGLAADTFSEMVQVAPAANEGIATLTPGEPPVAPVATAAQLLVKAGVEATSTPMGRVSMKAMEAALTEFGLVTLKLRLDVPLGRIELGVNAFESVSAVSAVKVALAATPAGSPVAVIVLVVLL